MGGLIIEGGEQTIFFCPWERQNCEVTAVELEGMSFGKPGWLTSGITDCRKSIPGFKTLRHFH